MTRAQRILLVDDEVSIQRAVAPLLRSRGYEVDVAGTGGDAIKSWSARRPDLIILDLGLPDIEGPDVCRRVRAESDVPIVVLSARSGEGDKVSALDLGADDYVTKPFNPEELLARIRVALRRVLSPAAITGKAAYGQIAIDYDRRRVQRGDEEIRLTPKEFDLLSLLAQNSDRVITHRAILTSIWGGNAVDQPEHLWVLISQLRKKIEIDPGHPQIVVSEPWVGYRFVSDWENIRVSKEALPSTERGRATKVVVATSVMLSFISFWRAAAIVLNDLGSSAYYVGGIAEQAVGRASPWFILGVMLFSYAVRAVYVESCAMFTRGGVYRVVKEAMGGTLAKLSVSALMFDYILTGPISGVSAGQYIVGLVAQTATYFGHPWSPTADAVNLWAAGIAVLVTAYFWWRNTKGIHESSDDALKIMYVTTVMVVLLIAWCGVTIVGRPEAQRLPPAPVVGNLNFTPDAVGWMPKVFPHSLVAVPNASPSAPEPASPASPAPEPSYRFIPNAGALLGLIGILMAFGHSFLAMSGEESLAQVNRELEYPKHANLMKAGMVIFVYSLLFTSLVSFFAYALIPDEVRPQYFNNLISGISMYLAGPMPIKLLFQGFIVIVGFLMLAGAINTSIIGSNGVLNRVSEDGVMTDWFRAPHRKYGTTSRMINLIVILQLVAIIGSRGNTYTLGEAYAFGVIWSFAFKGLAMLVLRHKDKSHREWKVPFNIQLGGSELPIGLGVIAALLFSVAGINLITKEVATVSGVGFTLVFFVVFVVSEHLNERKRGAESHVEMDHFRLHPQETISSETVEVGPGNSLCVVRDYNTLDHVKKSLDMTHTGKRDMVVMTVHMMKGPDAGHEDISEDELFTRYEQLLFSRVTAVAEKAGKHVNLLVVPGTNVFDAITQTAAQLDSADIWAGRSSVMEPVEQARRMGEAWERLLSKPERQVCFHVVDPDGTVHDFNLGAHVPTLTVEDADLIHTLWLEATRERGVEDLHHKEIVTVALAKLADEMEGAGRQATLERMRVLVAGRSRTAPGDR